MNDEPIAYFITWTCYGTWLPGDERGWIKWHKGEHIPQPLLADWCRRKMVENPVLLDETQRQIVHETIRKHCEIRGWRLHAVNCRSNHCHTVVTAPSHAGEVVRDQLKAWCTRKLKDHQKQTLKRQGASPPVPTRVEQTNVAMDAASNGEIPDGSRRTATTLRQHWWTRKGSVRHLFDEESLEAATIYTLEAQDAGGSKANIKRQGASPPVNETNRKRQGASPPVIQQTDTDTTPTPDGLRRAAREREE